MTTGDVFILRALARGEPVTVSDVTGHFMIPVRRRLEKLRARGWWSEKAKAAPREFKYTLIRPDRLAKAISDKGGGLSGAQWSAISTASAVGRLGRI
jgi:hypothetical protein